VAAGAGDFDCVVVARDFCAEGFDAGEGGGAVGSCGEIGEAGGSLREPAEQCVTVADTFVAGQAEAALDVAGGVDEAFGGSGLQSLSEKYWLCLSYLLGLKKAFSAQRSAIRNAPGADGIDDGDCRCLISTLRYARLGS
jgi:hypothetical protein